MKYILYGTEKRMLNKLLQQIRQKPENYFWGDIKEQELPSLKKYNLKKQNQTTRSIEEFVNEVNLYRLISGGTGKGLVLLRKIVDKIHSDNYSSPGTKIPSILICGKEGTRIHALALLNSLCIIDVRECDGRYYDSGINSKEIFEDSLYGSAHLITNIQQLRPAQETTIWRFLRTGWCPYTIFPDKVKMILHCNGMILLTANDMSKVSPQILSAVDYKVEIEPYTRQQLELIVHQRLRFCNINYNDDDKVLKNIIEYGDGEIKRIIDFLKICILLAQSDDRKLTLKIINQAKKLI